MRNVEWLWEANVGTVVVGKVLRGECLTSYRTLIVVPHSDVQPSSFLSYPFYSDKLLKQLKGSPPTNKSAEPPKSLP